MLYSERPEHDGDVFSLRHPKMPPAQRAKIFAPFDALRGFNFRISNAAAETEYVLQHSLGEDDAQALDTALRQLHELTANGSLARAHRPVATVTYFVPCDNPESPAYGERGLYLTRTGIVDRVDIARKVIVVDGLEIMFKTLERIETTINA